MLYKMMRDDMYVPMKERELAIVLQVKPEKRLLLTKVLEELLADGKIEKSKRGKYSAVKIKREKKPERLKEKPNESPMIELISPTPAKGRYPRRSRKEAVVKEDSSTSEMPSFIIGTLEKSNGFGFVVPDNRKISADIFIPSGAALGAADGHKVVVELTKTGSERRNPEGKIIEIIGHTNDPGTDILSIVKAYDIPYQFGEETLKQAELTQDSVLESDLAGRRDLRNITMVTIDGADAKDLDDAISLNKEGENYRLGVHIADVTNYVQENSALDREARLRGTSVYLVDRVIPMLPHALSNGICSLNAGSDRLALSCIMLVSPKGEVLEHEIVETVIHIDRRMTYEAVREILEDKNKDTIREHQEFYSMFILMEELAAVLRRMRKKRGSIDFEFPECKILVDSAGIPYDVRPYLPNTATRIIEEFMILANETVAAHFFKLKSAFVYRSHGDPDPDKIELLKLTLGNFGFKMGGSRAKPVKAKPSRKNEKSKDKLKDKLYLAAQTEKIHPRVIQKILKQAAGTAYEATINRLTLRSMRRAEYSPNETSHFGLASSFYCHFTSPIRRYPDLQIHRIIKEHLQGRYTKKRSDYYHSILTDVAKQSSELERRAEETEREVDKLKKAEYMESHLGEIYEGIISGVTAWGFYVELPNTIEGLVHIRTIKGDYFIFDEMTHRLVGRRTGYSYRLGQAVKIWVKAADKWSRIIDFELVEV